MPVRLVSFCVVDHMMVCVDCFDVVDVIEHDSCCVYQFVVQAAVFLSELRYLEVLVLQVA